MKLELEQILNTLPLTTEDEQLVESAKEVIAKYYQLNKHHVGAALRTKSGKVFTAVHLEANVGRVAVCAEAIAIGKAISEGENEFTTIVAAMRSDEDEQQQEMHVVSPCGMCRELISDYGPDMQVIFIDNGELKKVSVLELLPGKFTRSWG